MNYIPFIALIRFLKIVIRMGGLSIKGTIHLLPWIAKLIILEPLRLAEVIIFERKINRNVISKSPVFILGHYRSGTTYLQRLFSLDKRLGHMSVVQQIAPELMLLFETPLTRIMQWVSDLFKAQNHYHRVQHDWSYPGEEDIALMSLLSNYSSTWSLMFPKHFTSFFMDTTKLEEDSIRQKWQKDYLYLLNKLSLKNRGKQLVLKSPPNTARIKKLKELFPEAKFVFISRDPYQLFSSMKRLWMVTIKYHSLGSAKGIEIDQLILNGFKILMDDYLEEKKQIGENNLVEIDYEQLVQNPVTTMQQIYSQLDLPDFGFCKDTIQQFANKQKCYERLNHKLPDEVKQMILEKWSAYIQEYEIIKNRA